MLESKIPVMQATRFIFTTVTGWDDSEIIGLKCKELKILRVIGESFDELKARAEIFFDENNDDPRNKIFFIQSLYSENVSY
jgi:hypothetical protein